MKKVAFRVNGQRIDGTLITPKKLQDKNPAVIFFHGTTSNEKNYIPIAELLAEQGIVGLTINLRGHGTSQGNFSDLTITDGVFDGLGAYDFLSEHDFIDQSRIGLCGSSLGGTIAAMVAGERQVNSLILRVPATYTNEMMTYTYEKIMSYEGKAFQQMQDIEQTLPVKEMNHFLGRVLVIASENDATIPERMTRAFIQEATKAKEKKFEMMAEATHSLSKEIWRQEFVDLVEDWFIKTL